MPTYIGNRGGGSNAATRDFVVATGVTVTKGDFVYFDGDGEITNASIATQRLVGLADETVVGDDALTCRVIVNEDAIYLVDNDNDSTTFGAEHVGTFFDLTGATGAQLVDTSTTATTTAQLFCLEYNPQGPGDISTDTSQGLFTIAESALHGDF